VPGVEEARLELGGSVGGLEAEVGVAGGGSAGVVFGLGEGEVVVGGGSVVLAGEEGEAALFTDEEAEDFDGEFIDDLDAFAAERAEVEEGVAESEVEEVAAGVVEGRGEVGLELAWEGH
jgi:hypothetical protein